MPHEPVHCGVDHRAHPRCGSDPLLDRQGPRQVDPSPWARSVSAIPVTPDLAGRSCGLRARFPATATTEERARMPPAKRSGSRKSATRTAAKEPAALRTLNKSLDSAQDALAALGKEVARMSAVGRETSTTISRGSSRTHAATAEGSEGPCSATSSGSRSGWRVPQPGGRPGRADERRQDARRLRGRQPGTGRRPGPAAADSYRDIEPATRPRCRGLESGVGHRPL